LSTHQYNSVRENVELGPLRTKSVSVAKPRIVRDIFTDNDKHEDFMIKQSPSFHKAWQKRYFVLDKKILKYFKSKAEYEA
jgi:hypothetical protein